MSALIQRIFVNATYESRVLAHIRIDSPGIRNLYRAFKEKERKKRASFCSARNSRGCFVRTRAVTEHDLRVENRAASEKLLVVRTSANMWLTQSSRQRVRAGQSHAFIHLCNRSLFLPFSRVSRVVHDPLAFSFPRNNPLSPSSSDRNHSLEYVFTGTYGQN